MALVNTSKPTTSLSNVTKVTSAELWSTISSAWATETRTWDECISLFDNTNRPVYPALGWASVYAIVVNSSKVSGAQTNFPVYVDLSGFDANFFADVKSDGSDIRVFTSDNATQVPYELVTIDTSAKTGQLWFKGDISSSADTTFYIQVGNPSASAYAASDTYGSQNVWTGYVFVHHLQGNANDSTSNDEDGTISGAVSATGQLGTAYDFDGIDDYIEMAHNANQLLTSGLTITAWIKPDSVGETTGRILDKSAGTAGENGFYFRCTATNKVEFKVGTGAIANPVQGATGAVVFGSGIFYFVSVTLDAAGNVVHYLNGAVSGTPAATNAATNITTTNVLRIGNRSGGTDRTYDGVIDEVRLYPSALDATKILTEYNNQSSPSTFYTLRNMGITNISKPS